MLESNKTYASLHGSYINILTLSKNINPILYIVLSPILCELSKCPCNQALLLSRYAPLHDLFLFHLWYAN